MEESTKISFHFHPFDWANKSHAVEKSDGGMKRKYLVGVSSGIDRDLHGERMTPECIKSFQNQANSGDILLYEGQHGVNFIDDIGKLVHSEIDPHGNWMTEYRLYDEEDGFDSKSNTLEKANKLWKQVSGLPPYSKPRQKGFSIEGEVPDGGIVEMDSSGRRVLADVMLDGVVVVPRPAYKDSIASAVCKALGILPPDVATKVEKNLRERLDERIRQANQQDNIFYKKLQIEEGLEQAIVDIVSQDRHGTSKEKLEILFQQYSDLMIDLILQHEDFFRQEGIADGNGEIYQETTRLRLLKGLESTLSLYKNIRGGKE